MPGKIRTRLCGRCGKQQRTGNGYCANCNAIRMQESRGKVPKPETKEGQNVREITDKAFDLLDAVPGAEVSVRGIDVKSNEDGTVTFTAKNRDQHRRLQQAQEKLKELGA